MCVGLRATWGTDVCADFPGKQRGRIITGRRWRHIGSRKQKGFRLSVRAQGSGLGNMTGRGQRDKKFGGSRHNRKRIRSRNKTCRM